MKHYLKKYLKYYKVRERLSKSKRDEQQLFVQRIRKEASEKQLSPISKNGFKNFSQFEEDGLVLYLFALLETKNKTFVEFGADDGINSNAANLHFHHNFTGLFIDGNPKAIERGRHFYKKHGNPKVSAPTFLEAMITAENINDLITKSGLEGDIGFLSVDIDGNDYWVWKAIDCVKPEVVVIETHNEFGLHDIIVPYDPDYFYPGKHPDYHGASPIAMTKVAKSKGYRLVGSNELGFNFIFVREDLLNDLVPTVSVESLLQHPSNKEAQARFEAIKDWEYVTEDI
ncbi:hypothetical protein N9355_06200 [Crocinitomicaceae bacterium]|nr:hypothetical protein [Crocinitomicaceae bacterium]